VSFGNIIYLKEILYDETKMFYNLITPINFYRKCICTVSDDSDYTWISVTCKLYTTNTASYTGTADNLTTTAASASAANPISTTADLSATFHGKAIRV
jgi:hypothetical protein